VIFVRVGKLTTFNLLFDSTNLTTDINRNVRENKNKNNEICYYKGPDSTRAGKLKVVKALFDIKVLKKETFVTIVDQKKKKKRWTHTQ
jgi:hypothetical protein